MDMYVKKNIHTGEIHGGALSAIFKSVFGKTMKGAVKTASKRLFKLQLLKQDNMLVKKQVIK